MNCLIKKLFILIVFAHTTLFANEQYISKANQLNLHKNSYWLKLLHFEDEKSIINNQEFFLSPNGKTDPKQELESTIEQISTQPQLICKYPARYKWLKSKLGIFIDEKKIECKKLDIYLAKEFQNISIVFTSERYDSPSSIFGHTFLKLETKTIPYAINYAAKVPDNENKFLYAYRGITGKYPSAYTLLPFNRKDYEYRAQEFRDLIQFEINFSKEELHNIVLHLYEIQETNQDYYFIGRNCSSELIKLLDMAKYDSLLTKQLAYPTIPIDIVYILEEKKLISKITTQISKLKMFYKYHEQLDDKSKELLFQIIEHKISINKFDKDPNISFQKKRLIILTSIAYLEMISTSKKFENKHLYSLLKLIKLSHKYKLKSKFHKNIELNNNPISNKFHKLSLGKRFSNEKEDVILFNYRHLYRSRFDLVDDIKKNGSVEFLDVTVQKTQNKTSLNKFILLNLEAIPSSNDFFQNTTSKMSLGAKREFSTDKLYNFFDYGLGYKRKLNQNFDFHIFGDFGFYYFDEDLYKTSLHSSLEYFYKNSFISELKYEFKTFSNGLESKNVSLNNYLKIRKNTILNLKLEHKKDFEEYSNLLFQYTFMF